MCAYHLNITSNVTMTIKHKVTIMASSPSFLFTVIAIAVSIFIWFLSSIFNRNGWSPAGSPAMRRGSLLYRRHPALWPVPVSSGYVDQPDQSQGRFGVLWMSKRLLLSWRVNWAYWSMSYWSPLSSRYVYCIRGYFRGGFIFAKFAIQTLMKISTAIYVYL